MKQFLSHAWASCMHLTAHCRDLSSRQPSQDPHGSVNSCFASCLRQNTTSPLSVRHALSGLKHGITHKRHPPRIGLLRRFAIFVLPTCLRNLLADRPLFTLILLTGRIACSWLICALAHKCRIIIILYKNYATTCNIKSLFCYLFPTTFVVGALPF